MTVPAASEQPDELEVLREDCDLYLSRRMFGWIVDGCHHNDPPLFTETRTLDEFLADQKRLRKETR